MNKRFTRFFKVLWGTLNEQAKEKANKTKVKDDRLMEDLKNIHASYRELIQNIQTNIQSYKQAIGQSIALIEQKKNQLRCDKTDIIHLEKELITANLVLESTTTLLKNSGNTNEQIEQDTKYLRCYDTQRGVRSSLDKKKVRIGQLEDEIKKEQNTLESHKLRIVVLREGLDKIEIKNEVVTDLIMTHGKEDIAETLSRISMVDITTELTISHENGVKITESIS
ncbi:hypothetical protein C6497_08860 [Candidatus Poribacteria bacterium]|nr:MAG: hypothetical protein C6497_08860 [Candidatus Poribacteria bacterium]